MATTDTRETTSPSFEEVTSSITQGQLPARTTTGLAIGAVVLGVGLGAIVSTSNYGLMALLALVLYVVPLYGMSRRVEGSRKAVDRMVTTAVVVAFLLAMLPLVSVITTVVTNGAGRFDVAFFTETMRNVVGAGGGAFHAIMGTLIVTGLTAAMSVPLGILVAIYLVEYGRGPLARSVTLLVDVMTGIPSIVAGLFAAGLFTQLVGPGTRTGFAGAVALTVLMTPIVVRSTEEMLRLVPNELREASYGLGVPKWRTITKVVLPTSIGGILTGITLSIARVIGETAPLLVAIGDTDSTNLNPFDGRMASIPVFAYFQYAAPGVNVEPYINRSWAASLTLMVIVMVLFGLARVLANVLKPKGLK